MNKHLFSQMSAPIFAKWGFCSKHLDNILIASIITRIVDVYMTSNEKMRKVEQDFSLLTGEKQNYVLGILQALSFACYVQKESVSVEFNYKEVDDDER